MSHPDSDTPSDLHQVWCVTYDSDTPNMDSSHNPVRMHEMPSPELAQQALELVERRSVRSPKRNLRVETRWVSAWQIEETR